jgi:hypothetical protein
MGVRRRKQPTRIDTKSSKTARMFELFLRLYRSNRAVALEELDSDDWGCGKTVSRTLRELNEIWEKHHNRPLFEIVDSDGQPAQRGSRFLRVVDDSLVSYRAERLAVFPAMLEFLKVLDGTILADEIGPIFERIIAQDGNSRKASVSFEKLAKKFQLVGKGVKNYSAQGDVLDAVYDALLKEQQLRVVVRRSNESQTHILCPLTLVLFNNGLYLLAQFADQDQSTPPYRWKIESFESAESLRGKRFPYPSSYDPQKLFDGEFGIYSGRGSEKQLVEIAFVNDPDVRDYVQSRRFTGHETYRELPDGRLVMRLEVSDLTEIRSWIFSWGPRAEVLSPPALRKEVVDAVRDLSLLYSA